MFLKKIIIILVFFFNILLANNLILKDSYKPNKSSQDILYSLNSKALFLIINKKIKEKDKISIPLEYIKFFMKSKYKQYIYILGINSLLKLGFIKDQKDLNYRLKNLFNKKYFDFVDSYIALLFFYLNNDYSKTYYYLNIIQNNSLSLIRNNILKEIYLIIFKDVLINNKNNKEIEKRFKNVLVYLLDNFYQCNLYLDNYSRNLCILNYLDNNFNYKTITFLFFLND